MKPLVVLLTVFVISLLGNNLLFHDYELAFLGQISMAVMLLFTSVGHFKFPKGMAMMLPESIPFKMQLVYTTGVFEILAAISLLVLPYKALTGWLLIIFFILIIPANIYAAVKRINFEKGTYDGKGPKYLWFRIPLQIFFIFWIYFSVIAT